MTVAGFVLKHKPTFKAIQVYNRPDNHGFRKDARHYLVTLATHRDEYVFFYSMGSAIKDGPMLSEILESLVIDCQIGDMTFKEADGEMGGIDRKVWMSCRACRDSLVDVFGRNGYHNLLSIEF